MNKYSLSHLTDRTLLRDLAVLVAKDRATTAELLAHIAEVDARKLYLPAAYPSMFAYCLGEFRFSEDMAFKRIRVARAGRRFPDIFEALAHGRLNLSAVLLLRPYLTKKTAPDLLTAAANETNSEIKRLLAARFPQPDLPTRVEPLSSPASPPTEQVAARPVASEPETRENHEPQASAAIEPFALWPRVEPLAPHRFALQVTISQSTHDKLRYAQELLSHQIPSGDIPEVLERALDALILKLEKTKFAATDKPRQAQRRAGVSTRYIPAHVKRAVRKRDGGRCTYVSETGQRCSSRRFLEFDHGAS